MALDPALIELRDHFLAASDEVFVTSPLYQAFCPAIAEDPVSLRLLLDRRSGQQASYLLFGAVRYLLPQADHPLAARYVEPAPVPSKAGELFLDFVHTHQAELAALIRTRLVQTNVVRRSVGLRYGLAVIARQVSEPIQLIEVGASAGVHLQVDRYRFAFGDRPIGPEDSPLTIRTELRAEPDVELDLMPPVAARIGVDLLPVDVTDPDQRRWLRALVWPENEADAELLERALALTAADPPRLIAGDAIAVCASLGREVPAGRPRVVFHAATRMHVPRERWAAFDRAIDAIGGSGPLFHLWQESPAVTHGGGPVVNDRAGLFMHGPDGRIIALAAIDGHGAWLEPLELPS